MEPSQTFEYTNELNYSVVVNAIKVQSRLMKVEHDRQIKEKEKHRFWSFTEKRGIEEHCAAGKVSGGRRTGNQREMMLGCITMWGRGILSI